MFYNLQPKSKKKLYKRFLNGAAILGKLNSPKSKTPQIDSRASEDVFCRTFQAKDLGRKDISIDACKLKDGIGIKTFQGGPLQKIAEFNNRKKYPIPSKPMDIANSISKYRNIRLEDTWNSYSLKRMIYHSVFRKSNQEIQIFEQPMTPINNDKIELIEYKNDQIIKFTDKKQFYSFNRTKSILYQQFSLQSPLDSFKYNFNKADIDFYIENIYPEIEEHVAIDSVILKLFSEKQKAVPLKSGLNQWNAGGRKRHSDEVYIPIPRKVHKEKPGFFPPRDQSFRIETDTGLKFLAKVCQDSDKALMSYPNKSLGNWILRDVLGMNKNQLVTLNLLKNKNVNSVKIDKFDEGNYKIFPLFKK
ncbi:NgoFVII family restriction endonuclease [Candidatus Marinimicrobia bacterium]|nr:NgoFVII family restriction endonuclease [Candidatus Neomarinimicrobiota bacterium]